MSIRKGYYKSRDEAIEAIEYVMVLFKSRYPAQPEGNIATAEREMYDFVSRLLELEDGFNSPSPVWEKEMQL